MPSALCKSLLVAVALFCCYLPAYSQCVAADCDPPAVITANVVINVPWPAGGGAGCFLEVNITTRQCLPAGRCEVFFNSIERSACCSALFSTTTAAAVVAAVRNWLFANPPVGNPPCAAGIRIVHPTCWTKDNTAGTMTPCGDPPCCYIQGPVGGPPGPVTVIGVATCTLPCIAVCP